MQGIIRPTSWDVDAVAAATGVPRATLMQWCKRDSGVISLNGHVDERGKRGAGHAHRFGLDSVIHVATIGHLTRLSISPSRAAMCSLSFCFAGGEVAADGTYRLPGHLFHGDGITLLISRPDRVYGQLMEIQRTAPAFRAWIDTAEAALGCAIVNMNRLVNEVHQKLGLTDADIVQAPYAAFTSEAAD